jgi:hypothetical protein
MTILIHFRRTGIAALAGWLLIVSCTDDDSGDGDTTAGSSHAEAGSPATGSGAEGGTGDAQAGAGGAPVVGGTAGAGDAGGGGAKACLVVECEGLDEEACQAKMTQEEYAGGCAPRYGAPWPGDPYANKQYAGCVTACCGDEDCGFPSANWCVHPPDMSNDCWTIPQPPAPDGWVELGLDPCEYFPQCLE